MKLTEREKQVTVDLFRAVQRRLCALLEALQEKGSKLRWGGRETEFNLVYDRGSKFDRMTGGYAEVMMVSMPPVVKW